MKVLSRKIGWTKDFDSAHFLVLEYDSKCRRLHGHTYKVDVEVWGELDEYGMIFDYNKLSEIIKGLDHKILVSVVWVEEETKNKVIVDMNNKRLELPRDDVVVLNKPNVTAENLAEYLAEKIMDEAGENVRIVKVRVWEDPRSYAEILVER